MEKNYLNRTGFYIALIMIGLSFAIVSVVLLLSDYYIQIAVIKPSLINGETEGIAILSQYNPHGIFIALEEIGYITMILALFSIAREKKIVVTGAGIAGLSAGKKRRNL